MAFPTLEDAEGIRQYVLSNPTAGVETNAILNEINHWQKLLNERLWQECHKTNNPGDKGEIFRWGSNLLAVLGIPVLFLALHSLHYWQLRRLA